MSKSVTYEVARLQHDPVKPIRGTTIRPIGNRRRKHEHMVMLENGDVQFICYKTPVLTVHKDDSFSIAHGGWVTPTTSNFLRWTLAYVFGVKYPVMSSWKHDNQLWLVQGGRWEGESCKTMPLTDKPVRYAYNPETNLYQPSAPITINKTRTRVNKEETKDAYEQCKDLLEWLNAFGKLFDGETVSTADAWSYEEAYYIRNPAQLAPRFKSLWPNSEEKYKARRKWLIDTLTGDDPERFMQLLVNVCGGDMTYFPTINSLYRININYKKAKAKILHLIKCAFDCYEDKVVDVEYTFDRKAKW